MAELASEIVKTFFAEIREKGSLTTRSTSGLTLYDTSSIQVGTGGDLSLTSTSTEFNAGSQFNVQAIAINLPGTASTVNDPGAITLNRTSHSKEVTERTSVFLQCLEYFAVVVTNPVNLVENNSVSVMAFNVFFRVFPK